MAIIKDSDLFDFDRYRQQLAETGAAAFAFAQASEASAARIKTAYDGTQAQLDTIGQQLKTLSTQQADKAAQAFKNYDEQIDKLAKDAERYKTLLKQLDDTQSASGFSITEMTRLLSGLEKEYKAIQPHQADFVSKQREIGEKVRAVSTVLNAQNAVLREAKRATDAAEGSYAKLSQETNDLRSALRNMPDAFNQTTRAINKNNTAAVEMHAIIQRNDRALKTMDASMGQHQRNVGDYSGALRGVSSNALLAAGGLIGITSALDAVTAGLGVISNMERIDASLKAVSKDTADFRYTQEFLIGTADRLGLKYEILAQSYKGLKAATNGTALEGKATQQVFSGLVNSGAALKLSNEEVQGAIFAVTQMMSKGKVSAEELRQQLAERLPGAVKLLADAMGISEPKLNKMMEQGQLLAVDVLPKLATQLDKTYGKDAQSNVETMAGGWNRLTNQVHLFLAALNENQAISNTTNNFQNMITETLKGLRVAVQSNDWQTFFGAMMPGAGGMRARQTVANNAQNDTVLSEFKTMTPKQREARIGITKDNIARNENDLKHKYANTIAGGGKAAAENALMRDRELLRQLNRENIKQQVKDRKDADQAEINAVRAADAKKENDKDRLAKEAKSRAAARTKAENEAEKRLNDSLSKAKAGTDLKIAGLSAEKQDGIISEKTFIEERQKLTIAGIDERQALLTKAGKKESDDYKQLSKDKIEAETEYKRDSMKLALTDAKGATAGKLAGIGEQKNEGTISEAEFVEQKKKITIDGLNDQKKILAEAGQEESQLSKDLDTQILNATKDYYKERLKVTTDSWKKELDETKNALKAVDSTLAEEYNAQLLALNDFYDEKERAVQKAVAGNELSGEQGEQILHALRQNRLNEGLALTESTYAKDRSLSNALIDDKIAALNAYKADAIRTPSEILAAEEQIRKLKQQKEIEAADDKKRLDKSVADNSKQVSDETTEHEIANAKKAVEQRQQLWQAGLQLAGTIGETISGIAQANNQRDLDDLDKQKQNELALAGDNADAKQQIEEQYQKRKAEIQRKSAIQEREAALFSIAINTAQAVMSVLATGGGAHYLDFGVSAGILSAFVTAAGIAQAAAVLAKPLPAFWTGSSSTPEGFALVGDRGPELRQKSDGSYKYYDRPTVDYLGAGDRIYTASQTAQLAEQWQREEAARQSLQESLTYTQTADRLRDGQRNEQVIIHQLAAGSSPSLSKRDITEAMGKALDDRPQEVTIYDQEGVRRGRKRANNYQEYLEKRTRW